MATNRKISWLLFFISLGSVYYFIFCITNNLGEDLKPNEIFVRFAILFIYSIFSLIFIFMHTNKVLRKALLAITFMFAFGFILVPVYDVFCDVTGLNGKIDLSLTAATPDGIDLNRNITVEFVVNHNKEMPWDFKPQHVTLSLHPGEVGRTAYYAKNPTNKTMTSQAIPSISPSRASKYFKKIECFCFSSQKLGPKESAHLGLQFYLDKNLPKDIKRITLAYTLFDITGD